jgi:hypothetical protein
MTDPTTYARAFEANRDGQDVLDELTRIFGGAPFVPGQPDQTAYNCGAKAVIEHIHAMISKADRPQ